MIIETVEELRLHLPNHAYDEIDSMLGAFRRSEADVLKDKIGTPLYDKMIENYSKVDPTEKVPWLTGESSDSDYYAELTYLCQQVVVFDAFMRSADINAISINQSGINVVSAENYEVASKDGIAAYKKQLNKELHAAINRLLLWLEDLAKKPSPEPATVPSESSEVSPSSSSATFSLPQEIITLWQQSKYYYFIADLFISTATDFNRYVDIYDSREKFINLLPDIRFCQRQHIENELGDTFTADLLHKHMHGTKNPKEQKLLEMIQEAIALSVEDRSKYFDRRAAHDEAVGSIARMVEYARWNILDFDPEAVKSLPDYAVAKEQAEARANAQVAPPPPTEPWRNNQPGNAMLVMPAIY